MNMKKTFNYIMAAAAAVLALVACQREQIFDQAGLSRVQDGRVFQAVIAEGETRATIGLDGKISWNSGDDISVFYSTYNHKYSFQGKDGDRTGKFVPEEVNDFIAATPLDTNRVYAVYPYKAEKYALEGPDGQEFYSISGHAIMPDGTLIIDFPFSQGYVPGCRVAPGSNPMVAVTKGPGDDVLRFKNVGGYIGVPVVGSGSVTWLELRAKDNQALSGSFRVKASPAGAPEILSYERGYGFIEIIPDSPVALSEDVPTEFWFTVPPTDFEGGFEISVGMASGRSYNFETSITRTVERNTSYKMNTVSVNDNVSGEEQTYVDPDTGSEVFFCSEYFWDEYIDVVIKYTEVDGVRYCKAYKTDGTGFFGDEQGTVLEFTWYLDKYNEYGFQVIDLPIQYIGFDYSGWSSVPESEASNPAYITDAYGYYHDVRQQINTDADTFYANYGRDYPRSYYDPAGKFVFNLFFYIMSGGSFGGSFGFYDEGINIKAPLYKNYGLYGVTVSNASPGDNKAVMEVGCSVSAVRYLITETSNDDIDSIWKQLENGSYTEVSEFKGNGEHKTATVVLPVMEPGQYRFCYAAVDESGGLWGLQYTDFTVLEPENDTWVSLGTGLYTDDFITTFWGAGNQTMEVEIMQSQEDSTRYKMVYPYDAKYPHNEEGDWDTSKSYDIVFVVADANHVYIPFQETGMDWGYGMISIGTAAGYYLMNGYSVEEIESAGIAFGTLADGVITFPAGSGMISMTGYNSGSIYKSNINGALSIALPGAVVSEDGASAGAVSVRKKVSRSAMTLNAQPLILKK